MFSQSGDRASVPNVALLITDGIPNERQGDTIPQAENVKQHGIELVVVGITEDIDLDMLKVGKVYVVDHSFLSYQLPYIHTDGSQSSQVIIIKNLMAP